MRNLALLAVVVVGLGYPNSAAAAEPCCRFLKKVAKVVTAPVTAPVRAAVAVVEVVTGSKTPGEAATAIITQPISDVKEAAEVVSEVATGLHKVKSDVANALTDGAGKVLGEPGELIVSFTLLPASIGDAAGTTIVTHTTDVITGQAKLGPEDLISLTVAGPVALGLATSIEQANGRFRSRAQLLPDNVKAALGPHVSADILAKARYAVGRLEITLPVAVNGTQKLFGNTAHAVTVDDIIVFSVEPGTNWNWWAHELWHVKQYQQYGVKGFANRYIVNFGGIEGEAEAEGNRVEALIPR